MPGPAVLEWVHRTIGDLGRPKFRDAVKALAERQQTPIYQFNHKERKDDVANEFRRKRQGKKIDGQFLFTRDKTVYINHYYFYTDDADFGPLFHQSVQLRAVGNQTVFERA